MKTRRFTTFVLGLAALTVTLPSPTQAQDPGDSPMKSGSEPISDRDKAGLHGPVRSVIEERAYPAWTDADGKVYPEFKSWNKTEYDRDGRIAVTWFRGSSSEHGSVFATRYARNAAGQMLRATQEDDSKTVSETIYRYDDQGRLHSITDSKDPNDPIAFRYDANGRKRKIAIAQPIDLPSETGTVSHSVEASFEEAGGAQSLPDGGSAVTLYDEHDRPTEIQNRNANGETMSRTLRVYDDQGRVVEEKQIVDDPLEMIPAGEQKKILASGSVSPQEFRDKLAEFLGGSEMWSTKYSYDAKGHRSNMIRKVFNHMEERVDTAYNEHGDIAKEVSQSTTSGTGNPEADGTLSSETIYSYDYDSYGNWMVKKTSSRSLPDGTFKDLGDEVRRTIEYY